MGQRFISTLFFTRLLTAAIVANFISLVILNLLELSTYNLVYIWLAAALAVYQLTGAFRVRQIRVAPDKTSVLMVAIALVLLTVPRLVYLTAWLPDTETLAIADDYARLAELISITLSDRYPLRHPANMDYLLSFYYAGLFPMAFVKFVVPVLSLKDAMLIGNLFYHALVLGSLLEIAHLMLARVASIRWLLFFCMLFGGLDWLDKPFMPFQEFEWWQRTWFNSNSQISSFYTGMFWVIHHFVAFYAVVLAYAWFFYTRSTRPNFKPLLISLLGVAAFYTSPFSVMSVPLYGVLHRKVIWNKIIRTSPFPYVLIAGLVPLYIFLGKMSTQRFVWATFRLEMTEIYWIDKLLSAPIYFIVVPFVEYAGLPFLLLLVLSKLQRIEKQYFLVSTVFFAATYLIAYSGYNNFSMRGMFLPTFVVFFLVAEYSREIIDKIFHENRTMGMSPALIFIFVGLTFVGVIKMSTVSLRAALSNSAVTYRLLGRELPDKLKNDYRDLVRNPELTVYYPTDDDRFSQSKYNVEKFIEKLDVNEMEIWELELLRTPRRGLY